MDPQQLPDVPHVTDAYQKARKGYALGAGLLLGWELVGIELKDTPYFVLLSPEAAPLVLIALTFYFAARLNLEWFQLDSRRRKHYAARLDFWLAHLIGVVSLALYAIQRALEMQVAPYIVSSAFRIFLPFLGFAVGGSLTMHWSMYRELRNREPGAAVLAAILIVVALISVAGLFTIVTEAESLDRRAQGGLMGAGAVIGAAGYFWLVRTDRERRP